MRRFFILVSLLLAALNARAQSVHWEGSPDDPSEVQLVFDECSPDGDPALPVMTDNALTLTGNSTSTSIINGSFSRSHILTYSVRAKRAGAVLQIPAFVVQTNKGPKQVAAYTGGAARIISDATVNSRLVVDAPSVWAGEVFPITYVLDAARRSFSQLASALDWNAAPLVAEEWSKPEPAETAVGGEARITVTYRTRAYAKTAGTLQLNPVSQLVNIATGSIGFGLFQQQRVEQLSVISKRPEIAVKPLPPGAPPGFAGAVGEFKLASKVVPRTAAVGEPVTWTLELSGTGNWPEVAGLPQREVSKDFQVVQPQAKRTATDGKLFDATLAEDVVLVPTRPGTYTLNPVSFVYFDPKAGEYKTLSSPRTTITITAPASTTPPPIQVSSPEAATPPPPVKEENKPAPTVPPEPAGLPRDPLPGASHAVKPLPAAKLVEFALLPFAALLLFWGWLALTRARLTDPVRPRREARARLAAVLGKLPAARGAERRDLILQWQHDAALLWEIDHAAPSPAAIGDEPWKKLWAESDRALYRADTELPSDWIPRAEAALESKRVRGFSPLTALKPRNLAPFLALLVATLFIVPTRAEDAAAAYRRGDVAAAEKIWAADVAKDPTNPVARYNLSLALAQHDQWDLALAHATAALVQDPRNPSIRWQFTLAGEKAGFLPSGLASFLQGGPSRALSPLAPPGRWQLAIIISAAVFAASLGALLYSAYRGARRIVRQLSAAGMILSFCAALAAVVAIDAYGQAADARAVIVWRGSVLRSIPTEADTTQKSTALAAGSMAVIDNTYLGWIRLVFDNGQTGWVRKDDTVALWAK